MTDSVRLSPTTLSSPMSGWEAERDLRPMTGQAVDARFSPTEREAFGYDALRAHWMRELGAEEANAHDPMLPGLHAMLEQAIADRDAETVSSILATGLRTDVECMSSGHDPSGEGPPTFEDLTAVALAVVVDSLAGELQMLPLLAAHGNVLQVDSNHRTVLAYAGHRCVVDFLVGAGVVFDAVDGYGTSMRELVGEDIAAMVDAAHLEGAVPAGRPRETAPRL